MLYKSFQEMLEEELLLANEETINRIVKYLENDIPHCIYMYVDITTFGTSNTNVTTWYTENAKGINFVAMKYYDSFQLYAKDDDWNVNEIVDFLQQHGSPMISGRREIIDKISQSMSSEYIAEYGVIFELKKYRKTGLTNIVRQATLDDALEIAKLMWEDPLYHNNYQLEALRKQISDRIKTGTGRSFVIEDNGKIVVHDATFAETEKFFVTGGFIVHKDYRTKYYDTIMEDFMINEMETNGRRHFSFIMNPRREKLFKLMGNDVVAEYGKLVKTNN